MLSLVLAYSVLMIFLNVVIASILSGNLATSPMSARADAEQLRADRLVKKLCELGINPDEV